MCNIAGYIGSKNATPILLNMIMLQEGLNGGFYSGMAVHNGKTIDTVKLRGDFEKLIRETEVNGFIGNSGIAHSRTPSGGDGIWAHPFVSKPQNDVKMCYVANGSYGIYSADKEGYNTIADDLIADGIDIPCKTNNGCEKYNRLSSGEFVHISDVMCQLIYKHKLGGLDTTEAMTQAFTEMPSEIVGLVICKDDPDKIFFSRINMPMFVAFDGDGAYLASSPSAFPESVGEYKLLPALSSGYVSRDGFAFLPYPNFREKVHGFNRKTIMKATDIILDLTSVKECNVNEMRSALRKNMPKRVMLQVDAIVYIVIDKLLKSGKIVRRESVRWVDGQTAPLSLFKAVK